MIVYVAEILSVLLAICAIAVIRVRDLFALLVLVSVYSGLLAVTFAVLGAPDVAFTEAVVGASVSIVFFMALLWWVDPQELTRYPARRRMLAWIPAIALGAVLLYGINALPDFGDPLAPAITGAPPYLQNALADMATPNAVTAVLGDYRSFDTLIEAAVVLTAALACLLVLRRRDDSSV
jgi:multicomponent Na+:H+ antiporter subunit B